MNCVVHTDVEAKGYCRNCGKAMCDACKRDLRGIVYCEDCLVAAVTAPAPSPGSGNAVLAAILGFIPALGAVYNGEYLKAVIHFMIFSSLVQMASQDIAQPFSGMAIPGFIIYMSVEAYRTAKAKALGQKPTTPFSELTTDQPVAAYLLIGLGVLLLLTQIEIIPWDRITQFVIPAVLILVGFWLLRRRIQAGPQT
jgi:hypothetical protein